MADPRATALALPLADLDHCDVAFDDLRRRLKARKPYDLGSKPKTFEHDKVLLASFGPRGAGDLYVFVGMLHDAHLVGTKLSFKKVQRFWSPVVAAYGTRSRKALMGNRGAWGPHPFNYVLPEALTLVPKEAEALLKSGARAS